MPDLSNITKSFANLLSGDADTAQSVAFFETLSKRGNQTADLVALVRVLRDQALPFPPQPQAIDVCGTGGDGLDTPNISTAVALVVAGCGVPVVKHGNRAASSQSGSADVLEALGVHVEASAAASLHSLQQAHICFLFARHYHPAMRHVATARKAYGKRTLFNLAGPMANPAMPRQQLIGVYDRAWQRPMAEALHALGSHTVWVVHSRDGMDEISTLAPSDIVCMKNGIITELVINPTDYHLLCTDASALRGGDAHHNASLIRAVLDGTPSALADIICLNAAAALVVADHASSIADGLTEARKALTNGAARSCLEQLILLSQDS
jgi:anthranilate phosphoribosyltransferase